MRYTKRKNNKSNLEKIIQTKKKRKFYFNNLGKYNKSYKKNNKKNKKNKIILCSCPKNIFKKKIEKKLKVIN